jgi:predicted metal-dependent phosphotriesterase family hydrolase
VTVVRTVLGDVAPSSLGATYIHEHLILDNALIAGEFAHIHLPSVDDAVSELTACATAGVGAMVDAMPAAGGRHPDRLAEISRRTRIAIIATTGLHTPKYYIHHRWAIEASVDDLAELFVDDIEKGIDRFDYTGPVVARTGHRAGIVKVATPERQLTERDRRVFAAAVAACMRTGAPLLTHCEDGHGGMEQVAELDRLGMPLHRVVLSHTDKVDDLGYHRALFETGVNLEYDQALRLDPTAPGGTAALVAAAVSAGHVAQVMLGTDAARRSLWTSLGGSPGLAWLYTGFKDALVDRGLDRSDLEAIFVANPQRFLAFAEPGDPVSR